MSEQADHHVKMSALGNNWRIIRWARPYILLALEQPCQICPARQWFDLAGLIGNEDNLTRYTESAVAMDRRSEQLRSLS